MAVAAKKLQDTEQIEASSASDWALKLFSKSALKQRKLEMLRKHLEGIENSKTYLDIGSDNGVISYLLRKEGGTWHSADLIPETVESIRGLVGENVVQIDGRDLPFADNTFDCVVIVDLLEHIETDREFVQNLHRVLKPEGTLIVNVPDPNEGLLRKVRFALGQTDEAHGHLRAGYSESSLAALLSGLFEVKQQETYSRFFAELIDTLITGALDFLKRGGRSKKGTVVTGQDMQKLKKSFKLYSLIYPLMSVFITLDKACVFLKGNMRIASCRSLKQS
jgi:SAM-dependent methyltransferase